MPLVARSTGRGLVVRILGKRKKFLLTTFGLVAHSLLECDGWAVASVRDTRRTAQIDFMIDTEIGKRSGTKWDFGSLL